jgi:glyoxylase-like metal-dependent hydrolase (beta-lactamase superfamily II)
MRVLALHPDVLVATSAIWQTNCVVVRGGEETFVVDSPVLPEELDALAALLEQAGFPSPSGLLATHGDWDHLLGRLAFPDAALGCAQSTIERLNASPGAAQRELRAFDEQHLIERSRPLALGAVQALPVPGRCKLGAQQLELHPTAGHTADGMAILVPWARALLAGDYLSPGEIPVIGEEARAREEYVETLGRLRQLVHGADFVVPGHGSILRADDASAVLEQDLSYLRALAERGLDAELPREARSAFQRDLHRQNVSRSSARSRAAR